MQSTYMEHIISGQEGACRPPPPLHLSWEMGSRLSVLFLPSSPRQKKAQGVRVLIRQRGRRGWLGGSRVVYPPKNVKRVISFVWKSPFFLLSSPSSLVVTNDGSVCNKGRCDVIDWCVEDHRHVVLRR